ncbi:MAG TPA: RNA 2',3'-cyclic phosphodiesterase [Planctomycetaceae bacterium]|nr:RNA 2',3'-cyclic phosphodiesterase [Planctomycetaceae bacterium]
MPTLRTFIAVPIPSTPALRSVIARLAAMGRALKPVDPDHLHLTLKFLGDTDAGQVPAIGSAVRESVSGRQVFDLTLRGTGVFPHARRPTVVWAGIENAEPLIAIVAELEPRLEALGFTREHRAYQPHLTLARIRSRPPADLTELLERERAAEFGAAAVESVVVYQSDLQPGGPVYTPLETVGLE